MYLLQIGNICYLTRNTHIFLDELNRILFPIIFLQPDQFSLNDCFVYDQTGRSEHQEYGGD